MKRTFATFEYDEHKEQHNCVTLSETTVALLQDSCTAENTAKRQRTMIGEKTTSNNHLILAPLHACIDAAAILHRILSFVNGVEVLRKVCYPHMNNYIKFTSALIQMLFTKQQQAPYSGTTPAVAATNNDAKKLRYFARFTSFKFSSTNTVDKKLSNLMYMSNVVDKLVPMIKYSSCAESKITMLSFLSRVSFSKTTNFTMRMASILQRDPNDAFYDLRSFYYGAIGDYSNYHNSNTGASQSGSASQEEEATTKRNEKQALVQLQLVNSQLISNFKAGKRVKLQLNASQLNQIADNKEWLAQMLIACDGSLSLQVDVKQFTNCNEISPIALLCFFAVNNKMAFTPQLLQFEASYSAFQGFPMLLSYVYKLHLNHNDAAYFAPLSLSNNCQSMVITEAPKSSKNSVVGGLNEKSISGTVLSIQNLTASYKALKSIELHNIFTVYQLKDVLTNLQYSTTVKHLELHSITNDSETLFDLSQYFSIDRFKALVQASRLKRLVFVDCKFDKLEYMIAIAPLLKLRLQSCVFMNATMPDLVHATSYCDSNALMPPWQLTIENTISTSSVVTMQ